MGKLFIAIVVSGVVALLPLRLMADHHVKSLERAVEGTVDAVTAPGNIVEGIAEDAEEHGPVVGAISGTVKGTAKAAEQVVTGAAKVGVGAVEAILSPRTTD
ncbi:MAG TPA: hypothetical protein DGR97_10810 [Gammaproteobacteria bacterium]|nr:hypothetical protein [Gammaproteobacteria bacterium]